MQHRLAVDVREVDVREPQRGRAGRTVQCGLSVGHVAGGPQHAGDPVPADHAARQFGQYPADGPDRERQHGEQERHTHDVGDAHRALAHPPGAHHEHGQRAEARQRLQERVEQPADPTDPDLRVAQFARLSGEPRGLVGLPAHGLDHERAVEALVRDRADLRAQLLRRGHPGRDAPGVQHVDAQQRGEQRDADQREYPVGQEQRAHGRDQHDDRADRERERGDREPGGLHVGVRVGQQGAGGVPVVPGQRQAQVPPGDPPPVPGLQPGLHGPGTQPPAEQSQHLAHAHGQDRGGAEDDRGGTDVVVVERRHDGATDHGTDHERAADGEQAEHDAAAHPDREHQRLVADRPAQHP